jgi:hypothetical protein
MYTKKVNVTPRPGMKEPCGDINERQRPLGLVVLGLGMRLQDFLSSFGIIRWRAREERHTRLRKWRWNKR